MKLSISLVVVAAACAVVFVLPSRGRSPGPIDVLMARKLTSAQRVLEGLAMEDYGLIERESQQLHLLSQESDWNVLQTPDYARLSTDFRKTTQRLQEAAKSKNLDAVGLGYIKLTFTCIECHRHVRSVRKNAADTDE